MPPERLLDRLTNVRRFAANGVRAPHKPLLILNALGRLKHEGCTQIRYADAERVLAPLLRIYGAPGTRARVADPFARLESDGVWRLHDADRATLFDRGGNARPAILAEHNPAAGFDAETLALLRGNPLLIDQVAYRLLLANFPYNLHEDLLEQVGLELTKAVRIRRNPMFRVTVLEAYLYACAASGFSLRLQDGLVGLDAAHIRWHALGGPDTPDNGLALCVLHHRLFDLGVLTVDRDLQVRVAAGVNGASARALARLDRQRLDLPRDADLRPAPEHLDWHHRQVFRGAI
jgi:putative restriction endonuclease